MRPGPPDLPPGCTRSRSLPRSLDYGSMRGDPHVARELHRRAAWSRALGRMRPDSVPAWRVHLSRYFQPYRAGRRPAVVVSPAEHSRSARAVTVVPEEAAVRFQSTRRRSAPHRFARLRRDAAPRPGLEGLTDLIIAQSMRLAEALDAARSVSSVRIRWPSRGEPDQARQAGFAWARSSRPSPPRSRSRCGPGCGGAGGRGVCAHSLQAALSRHPQVAAVVVAAPQRRPSSAGLDPLLSF